MGPYTYSWSFGDGGTGIDASVSHTYASAGTFTVKVVVRDAFGAVRNSSIALTVLAPKSGSGTSGSFFESLEGWIVIGAVVAALAVAAVAVMMRRRGR